MRSYITAAALFGVFLLTVPAAPLVFGEKSDRPSVSQSETEKPDADTPTAEKSEKKKSGESYRILDVTTGKIEKISDFDYVVGAVCAEMPATFSEEALKAQAVAVRTYAQRQKLRASVSPDPELGGADLSNDPAKYQAYFTDNQARQYYGDRYEQYIEKIKKAVEATDGEILVYDGEPIIAAFHSMSSGMTENAKNVWGGTVDYLVPVESESDTAAPNYFREYTFSQEEMKELLTAAYPDIKLGDKPKKWLEVKSKSQSGTVLEAVAGDKSVTGQELRAALSLCSANFKVAYEDGVFTVSTKGCGHCVGMSQYGANSMAESGSDYREILSHYYPGTTIKEE